MRRWVAAYFLAPLSLCLWLAPSPVRAQAESKSDSAPPSASDVEDEWSGVARPKVVIDEVATDAPIHLPYSDLEPAIEELNKVGRSPDSSWLDEFLELGMRGVWQDRGYFKVKVDGRAEPRGSDGINQHFSVILHVDEGLQYRLGAVSFSVVPPPKETDSAVVTRRDVEAEKPDATADAPTKSIPLRRREHSEDVDHQSSAPPPPSSIDPSTPSSIDPPVFPVEKLRELLPLREGDILNVKKIREGLDGLKRLYGHAGYIDFTATPVTEVDDEHQTVDIRMELDEQKQYRLRKLEIKGLDAITQAALVWKLKPGDVFDVELFDQFFEDNKSLLPEGSSDQNAEVRRDQKQAKVDIRMHFHQYSYESISSRP